MDGCCTICACADDGSKTTTTLDCGHTFHVGCILEWFRYEHTTCPNCRSEGGVREWIAQTPTQCLTRLRRRRRSSLPWELQRGLTKVETTRERIKELRRVCRTFRRDHAEVFREARALERKVYEAHERYDRQVNELALAATGHVPLLVLREEEEDDEE